MMATVEAPRVAVKEDNWVVLAEVAAEEATED